MACDAAGIQEAARAAGSGRVIIFPTDTVYGVGCDPYDAGAVDAIYRIKSRSRSEPLPVLAPSVEAAAGMAEMGPAAGRIAGRFWPGAVTMVLPVRDARLQESMRLGGTVAVRVPAGGCISGILGACGPLAGTSANVSGEPAPSSAGAVRLPGCDLLVDGGESGGTESTIVDVSGPEPAILREGAVPGGEILRIS
ncbi:MAG: threonylcarbamoyl-AMP synthase [Nitrosopumilus sp.]|nr:threonylcarbamoyl-AMP synthase [Nitrosopumilus sp.]MDA7941406.1 threonylcarbamoyl-AMP synthase [Nitrosopumilus sp.]MDA7942814.1 threonylcarbamoyl-AMP synthase [Nitrosopumilus sp.]MDA7945100.1 threonylcarbamoyl-AMP synthase [Nitrosopumilus sp.]MDA7952671.1 threonylcarbamoyl-AMP synthase [Nitrosopumilus sp.]